jgi:hypothetical protein
MLPAKPRQRSTSSFLTSMPGLLTGIAALITAIFGGYAIFHHPVPTASLIANPTIIHKGQSSTLTWQTSDATVVNIEEIGPITANGSQLVTPDSSTTYHLTATGAGGTQKATAQISVTAREAPAIKDHPPHPGSTVPSGDWRGFLQAPPLPLAFHINLAGGSTSDSPNQGSFGMLTNVTVNANDVQLSVPSVQASFHGTLQGSTIDGTFSQHGVNLPLALARTVGGGNPGNINGDWQGTLTFPGVPLVLHIKLGGDSTCDSPTQGYYSVPMNVTSDGSTFQFDVPAAGMHFSGTVQGAEINGIFSQSGGSLPLRFVKQ